MSEKNVYLHIVESSSNDIITKHLARHVPSVNDEIRVGGEGGERFYKIDKVVWVYDEPENPFDRVNLGVTSVGMSQIAYLLED